MYSKTHKSSEVRKIQLTGGSTYTVSLPKKWIIEHGLEAKDEIRIEWRPSGALRVIADTSNLLRKREVKIDCEIIPDHMIFDHLIAAYLSGADKSKYPQIMNFPVFKAKFFVILFVLLVALRLLMIKATCSK